MKGSVNNLDFTLAAVDKERDRSEIQIATGGRIYESVYVLQ